jgi:two-component system OmpR family response regulator
MAALLKRGLGEDGHTVDVVLTGDDAWWHATEFSYDAVVLDVGSPAVDGVQLCKRLRERDRRTPVLMLTSKDSENGRVRGLDAGADAYLIEPFSFEDFSAQLTAMTHRWAAVRGDGLRVGELWLDPLTQLAWRGRTPLSLSSKEFALLRLFMSRPGRALSREYIFERIWDCTHQVSSNVVDQYVLYLRRKVDRPFWVRQIETVRGLGYRLREEPISTGGGLRYLSGERGMNPPEVVSPRRR